MIGAALGAVTYELLRTPLPDVPAAHQVIASDAVSSLRDEASQPKGGA